MRFGPIPIALPGKGTTLRAVIEEAYPAPPSGKARWKEIVADFQNPCLRRSIWQIVNSVGGFFVLAALTYWSMSFSWWLTAPLLFVAAGLYVRIFIIFHDCTHGSFFRSRKANDIVGFLTGVILFTPYHQWRWEHTNHHAGAGDLDSRGLGDVWTMTVQEYLDSSWLTRFRYRVNRHPIVLFVIAPITLFLILQRFPTKDSSKKVRRWLHYTNLALLAMAIFFSCLIGWKAYLIIQLGVLFVASTAGVWLFYIQHQFEGVSWERQENWDFAQAALEGSSFYRLPKILQWFSGNIGFHHVHHLSPRIPNYNLERCHEADELFRSVPAVTLRSSLNSFHFRLWDEENGKLVGFDHLRRRETRPASAVSE